MLYFYSLHDSPLLCEYGAISGADETRYQPHVDNYGYRRMRNAVCTKFIVSETRKGHILLNFWQLYPLTVFQGKQSEYLTTYYKLWYLLTPTWHHLLERTAGQQLLALNEIFRGSKTAAAFNESIASHQSGDLNSNDVYVLPANVYPQTLFGIIESHHYCTN